MKKNLIRVVTGLVAAALSLTVADPAGALTQRKAGGSQQDYYTSQP